MSSSMDKFPDLIISIADIKLATNDFDRANFLGEGGFGKVYKGELLLSTGLTVLVAVKRLDKKHGQGAPEFWKEILLLSTYKHENLVSLFGFCADGDEMILVYEYLANKSLDMYLSKSDISWNQRLCICIGAARGLRYLHEPAEGAQQRVIHRDIKSANILLDENWKAKIADFGLSKVGPANQQYTFVYSNAVGTQGYCDPSYATTCLLTKESDVYSFGVVLFEVLCGRRCVQTEFNDIRTSLPHLARKRYEEKKLDTIIHDSLKSQISPLCLERFSKIAYQCLQIDHTQRPLMTEIVKELEIALQLQEEYEFEKENELKRSMVSEESESDEYWETKLPRDLEVIIKMLKISNTEYTTKKELFSFLRKGVLFDEGNKFFWINDDGKICEAISSEICMEVKGHKFFSLKPDTSSRFPVVVDYPLFTTNGLRFKIKTSMLSLGTMYEARMVFKCSNSSHVQKKYNKFIEIKWKTNGLSVRSTQYVKPSNNNWYTITMWKFINLGPTANFDIFITGLSYHKGYTTLINGVVFQGIEFQPIEMHEDIEGFKSLLISDDGDDNDDDEYWEKKLPDAYPHFVKMSVKPLEYTTKKELYLCFREGFLCDDGRLWVSLCKSIHGICSMIKAATYDYDNDYYCLVFPSTESRFDKVAKLKKGRCYFWYRLLSHTFSPQYLYACYLVFKFEQDYVVSNENSLFKATCKLDDISISDLWNIPTIKPKNDYGSNDSSNIPEGHIEHVVDGKIKQRKDGWMEIILCKSLRKLQHHSSLKINLEVSDDWISSGMIIEGIEFRPCIS